MLELRTEFVCEVIARAREFHAKEEVVFPHEPADSSDDWAMQVLADHADDPTYIEVCTAIDALDPEGQASLVALMWLGRGDFEWDEARREARARWTPHTAAYLMGTPLVADYLEEGLNRLGLSCEED